MALLNEKGLGRREPTEPSELMRERTDLPIGTLSHL